MGLVWFFIAIASSSALRILSLTPMLQTTGHMNGIASATALCSASARNYSTANTSWVPYLETSPASLRDYLESFGGSIYPYTDARTGSVIWQNNLFAPGATTGVFQGEASSTQKFTGLSGGTCQSWTNTTGIGGSGTNVVGDQFWNSGTSSCSAFSSMACLEVPRTKALAPPIRFFVTRMRYSGNLGGLSGADAKCNAQAVANGTAIEPGGRFYALLNTRNMSATARIASVVSSQAIFLFGNTTPGSTIFHLTSDGKQAAFKQTNPYDFDQNGQKTSGQVVWIGSWSSTCNDWTLTSGASGWYVTPLGSTPLSPTATASCDTTQCPLFCLQYFSPIVSTSVVILASEASLTVTATMYDDVSWSMLRCVAVAGFNITNVTQFWGFQNGMGYSVAEVPFDGRSSMSVKLGGLGVGVSSYVTCAVRATSYIDLTWLVSAGAYFMPLSPEFGQNNPLTTRITFQLLANEIAMQIRCLAATGTVPAPAFWGVHPATVPVVEQSSTPNTEVWFTLPGLLSNTLYIVQCAQYKLGQDFNSSTAISSILVKTLPKCVDSPQDCPPDSECVDSPDLRLFQCSPYVDGGFKLSSNSSDFGVCRSAGGTDGSLRLNTTEGRESISFCVNLGERTSRDVVEQMTFYYGTTNNPKRFECSNVQFARESNNNTIGVTCSTANGIGADLNFSLIYQNNIHVISSDVLSYPPPVIRNSTLRLAEHIDSVGGEVLTLDIPQAIIAFDVQHVQLLPELKVFYGPNYQCQLDARTNSSVVVCSTSAATEFNSNGFTFTVNANGQVAHGTDKLKLPAGRPVITRITSTACNISNSSDGLVECPTQGHTFEQAAIITVWGTDFGSASSLLRVTIDGAGSCNIATRNVTANSTHFVTCFLPAGTGILRNVYVQNDIVVSAPRPLISYSPPTINQVCGCDSPCISAMIPSFTVIARLEDCNREGGQVIVLTGSNLGESGATVLVGVSRCSNLTHDAVSPHTRLRCVLPPGYETTRSLLVAQGNGAVNENSVATVSYRQCAPGTSQDSYFTTCRECISGFFTEISGLSQCLECAAGTFAPRSNSTACTPCAQGKYQPSPRGVECLGCPAGSFAAAPFSTICTLCVPGTFVNATNQSACENCPAGSSQPLAGQTSCASCPSGRFQNNVGKPECVACPSGKVTETPGRDSCRSCDTGQFQARTGASGCDWCLAGTFVDIVGAAECLRCEFGKYSDTSGRSACHDCPTGTAQPLDGATTCTNCSIGRFAGVAAVRNCEPCESGSVTFSSGASSCFICPFHSTAADSACPCDPGYGWANLTCEQCSRGQDCRSVGTVRARAEALPGFVRVGTSNATFQPCVYNTYCPGGSTRCAPYREGHLCQSCVAGYREDSRNLNGACSLCASESTSIANIVGAIVGCVAALVLLYYIVVRAGMDSLTPKNSEKVQWWDAIEAEQEQLGPKLDSETGEPEAPKEGVKRKITLNMAATREFRVPVSMAYQRKIIITFIQLATTSLSLSTLSMPPSFRVVLEAFDFVNLSVVPWSQVGCVKPFSLLTKIVVTAVAPVVILPIAAFLLVLALKLVDRCKSSHPQGGHSLQVATLTRKAEAKYRAVFLKVTLFTVFLVYPAVSRQIFSYFRCVEVLQEQTSLYLLKESFREECYNSEWTEGLFPVIVLICIYPLGVPLILGLILRHFRPRFQESYIRYTLGFVFEGFLPQFWFFELVDITHKFFISSLVTLLPDSAQVPVDMAILGAYLCVLHFAQPYVRKADNQFHMLTQTEIYLLVFCFLARDNTGPIPIGSEEDLLLSSLLLVLFLGIVVLFLIRVVRYAKNEIPTLQSCSFLRCCKPTR